MPYNEPDDYLMTDSWTQEQDNTLLEDWLLEYKSLYEEEYEDFDEDSFIQGFYENNKVKWEDEEYYLIYTPEEAFEDDMEYYYE